MGRWSRLVGDVFLTGSPSERLRWLDFAAATAPFTEELLLAVPLRCYGGRSVRGSNRLCADTTQCEDGRISHWRCAKVDFEDDALMSGVAALVDLLPSATRRGHLGNGTCGRAGGWVANIHVGHPGGERQPTPIYASDRNHWGYFVGRKPVVSRRGAMQDLWEIGWT